MALCLCPSVSVTSRSAIETDERIELAFGLVASFDHFLFAVSIVADPGGVQGVHIPAILFRCPFLKRTHFENMSLRFLAEQSAL